MNNRQSAANQVDYDMKDIPGFESLYAITKSGKVYSYRNNKFLKTAISKTGYEHITISVDGKRYDFRVHRLVAMTYLDNPENLPQVNHKDCNKLNNYLLNLEWCSPDENIEHAKVNDRFHGNGGHHEIRKAYKFTNVYNDKTFTIIGFRNLLKQLDCANNMYAIMHNANTGRYIRSGKLKGLKVDIIDLAVQRLTH